MPTSSAVVGTCCCGPCAPALPSTLYAHITNECGSGFPACMTFFNATFPMTWQGPTTPTQWTVSASGVSGNCQFDCTMNMNDGTQLQPCECGDLTGSITEFGTSGFLPTSQMMAGYSVSPVYMMFMGSVAGRFKVVITDDAAGTVVPTYIDGPLIGRTLPSTLHASVTLLSGTGACALGNFDLTFQRGSWSYTDTVCTCPSLGGGTNVPKWLNFWVPTGNGDTCSSDPNDPTPSPCAIELCCNVGGFGSANATLFSTNPLHARADIFYSITAGGGAAGPAPYTCCFQDPGYSNPTFRIDITE